jgi:predicted GNAT family acetyltransferase
MIQHDEDEKEGAFYVEQKGHRVAELVYRKERDRMIIQHTEVDESLQGKNIGFQLVEQGVKYARAANLKIVPLCVFAKKVIETHEAFHDVL